MSELNKLRSQISKGTFPNEFKEFGGAKLIITSDAKKLKRDDYSVVVVSEHAPALSWLVFELKLIYEKELDYLNKYDFYPYIGKLMNNALTKQELVFETMLHVVDQIEKDWGTR